MKIQNVGIQQAHHFFTNKMENAKNLTEQVVGGAVKKSIEHQKNMLSTQMQMNVQTNQMMQQASLINLFA